MSTPAEIDLLDPALRLDSPDCVAARERHWYATTPMGPLVLRYAECAELARDPRLGEMGTTVLAMQGVVDGPAFDLVASSVIGVDGAAHRRLRSAASGAFAPRRVEQLRESTRATADELADGLVGRDRVDFMAQFADRYPTRVMCRMLGIEDTWTDRLAHWIEEANLIWSMPLQEFLPRVEAALDALNAFADRLLDERRTNPGEDLVSQLLAAGGPEDRLNPAELRSWVIALLTSGHDDARCQLGHAVVAFGAHPDQWTLLRARPELRQAAMEEIWRCGPNVPVLFRVAHEDFVYRDLEVGTGEFVGLCLALAHTDPRVFAPGFDITVDRAPHVAFGAGPHFCIGYLLARMQLSVALEVLADRLPTLAPAGEPTWRPQVGIYGPATLPICTRSS
ncbi:MAG: cytochrome P450 [Sporichthyaceae bacterium]